jgi:hypothetical protein
VIPLIHGGRIEATSRVCLARVSVVLGDCRVLIPATVAVSADHFIRGATAR